MPPTKALLHTSAEEEKRKQNKKCPNSYFMDVKGSDAVKSPRSCVPAAALSCQTTGRKARLMGEAPLGGSGTESSWFKMSGDHPNKQTKLYVYIHTCVCVWKKEKRNFPSSSDKYSNQNIEGNRRITSNYCVATNCPLIYLKQSTAMPFWKLHVLILLSLAIDFTFSQIPVLISLTCLLTVPVLWCLPIGRISPE